MFVTFTITGYVTQTTKYTLQIKNNQQSQERGFLITVQWICHNKPDAKLYNDCMYISTCYIPDAVIF